MSLSSLRDQIDEIDSKILELFLERIDVCREVAEIKKSNDIPIENKKRESEILENIKSLSGNDFSYSEDLFKKIIEICKEVQNKDQLFFANGRATRSR